MEEQESNELYQSIGARIRIVDMGQLDILFFLDTTKILNSWPKKENFRSRAEL